MVRIGLAGIGFMGMNPLARRMKRIIPLVFPPRIGFT
jgi:hypothetical protein